MDPPQRIRGAFLAGAVGDALGAPVEFMTLDGIRTQHGPEGVTGFLPAYGRAGGAITDDTQMTLFTAEGMIRARVRGAHGGISNPPLVVMRAYWRWLTTQGERRPDVTPGLRVIDGWLVEVRGLWARRSPSSACLGALRTGRTGTMSDPINSSKGCGGVMRIAPIGYLPAGVVGAVVADLCAGEPLDAALDRATVTLRTYDDHHETTAALDAARALAATGRPSPEQLETLGAGGVGEEALAIAVCCALSADDLLDGLLLAVNHSGDTDSTGTIAGHLLGTIHGEDAITPLLLRDLELRDVVTRVAEDLADAFHGGGVGGGARPFDERAEEWLQRYPGH